LRTRRAGSRRPAQEQEGKAEGQRRHIRRSAAGTVGGFTRGRTGPFARIRRSAKQQIIRCVVRLSKSKTLREIERWPTPNHGRPERCNSDRRLRRDQPRESQIVRRDERRRARGWARPEPAGRQPRLARSRRGFATSGPFSDETIEYARRRRQRTRRGGWARGAAHLHGSAPARTQSRPECGISLEEQRPAIVFLPALEKIART